MLGTISLGAILDVTIGMMLIYFLLAQVAAGIQEAIAGVAGWRGSFMTKAVDVLLSNDPNASFSFLQSFVSTYLLPGPPRTGPERTLIAQHPKANDAAPTATSAMTAALQQRHALFAAAQAAQDDAVAVTGDHLLTLVQNVLNHPLMRGNPTANPRYIPAQKFSTALLDLLRDGSQAPLLTQVKNSVQTLPAGPLRTVLAAFLHDAGDDLDRLRSQIEGWFNDAMDEMTVLYKRLSRYVMVILGILLAASLNVDSVQLAKFLWLSPATAMGLVDVAGQLPQPPGNKDAAPVTAPAGTPAATAPDHSAQDIAAAQTALIKIRTLKLPIGWENTAPADAAPQNATGSAALWNTLSMHAVGWLLTAVAISLGAPFWYGLMQNLLSIRSSDKKSA